MSWFAIYTPPRMEAPSMDWMLRYDLDVFCPTVTEIIRKKVRGQNKFDIIKKEVPAYPRYVFAFYTPEAFGALRDTPMVGKLRPVAVREGEPALIPDKVIEAIREEFEGEHIVTPQEYLPGQIVRLSGLAGLTAMIASTERLRSHQEVSIWLDMFGKREVNIPVKHISAL